VERLLKTTAVDNISTALQGIGITLAPVDETAIKDILGYRAVGRFLQHRWYDEVNKTNILYNGKFEKVKQRRNKTLYLTAYWGPNESYNISVDYEVDKFELAADLVFGDLALVQV
jgi:hypothetical protein